MSLFHGGGGVGLIGHDLRREPAGSGRDGSVASGQYDYEYVDSRGLEVYRPCDMIVFF